MMCSFVLALLLFAVVGRARATEFMSPGMTPEQLFEKRGSGQAPLVVDVRYPKEYAVAHIPGAVNIPLAEIEKRIDEFRHDNGVLVYCINGARTRQAEAMLVAADVQNIYHLDGTFSGWIQAKHPIEKGGVKKGW
jgi:rhodanese-related sulfurtransferase